MRVSIVIPVYNRRDYIGRCLDSVLAQTFRDYEVIVVDDGSTDGTRDVLASYASRVTLYIHEHNLGVSEARNRGGLLARGDFVAVTDSDCVVAPDWLEELVKPFSFDEKIMITGGKVEDPAAAGYWQTVNKGLSTFIAQESGYVKRAIGCNLAVRRSFLLQNPYDRRLRFAAGDDTELCQRCRQKGFKVYYTDGARVVHYHRSRLRQGVPQHFIYGYVNTYTALKYREFPYVNCGCILILTAALLLVAGAAGFEPAYGAVIVCLVLFSYLPWHHSTASGRKTRREVIITYPGNYLLYTVFCIGSLAYFFMPRVFLGRQRPTGPTAALRA